ncbi:MAG: hypothetical protein ACRDQ9_17450 [Pseudonocardiaceae bacterium]
MSQGGLPEDVDDDDVDIPEFLPGAAHPHRALDSVTAGGVVLLDRRQPCVLEPVGHGGDLTGVINLGTGACRAQ